MSIGFDRGEASFINLGALLDDSAPVRINASVTTNLIASDVVSVSSSGSTIIHTCAHLSFDDSYFVPGLQQELMLIMNALDDTREAIGMHESRQ